MTRTRMVNSALVALMAGTSAWAGIIEMNDLQAWVGSGTNQAALVVDFHDGSAMERFAWGYRWNGTASGADMILAVVAADENLGMVSFGTGDSGFYLTSIAYDDGVESHSQISGSFATYPADYSSWGYYLSGGFSGDTVPFSEGGSPVAIAGGGTALPTSWTSAPSGASLDSFGDSGRILTHGAWDAWSFGQNSASYIHEAVPGTNVMAAIPEPSSVSMILVGFGGMLWVRRRRQYRFRD